MAVAAPLLAPYDPLANDWLAVRQAPSLAHPMGTDDLGRDVLSRVIWGRADLAAGRRALGADGDGDRHAVRHGGGLCRRLADLVISRITDALLACPQLMLAIALAMFLGASLLNATMAIGLVDGADLHPPGPWPDPADQGRALHRGGARRRQFRLAHRRPAHPAQPRAAADRAVHAVDRRRHHRRGRAVLPRPRPPAAGAVLGHAC